MATKQKQIALSNGARLAFEEYGDPNGTPVIFCHGWPSSRTMAELTHEAACAIGARIISPDRPGIRDSSFQQNRSLLDWPVVMREMVDKLELGKFRVLGISGGGPYALVMAWAMSECVEAIAVVSGAPPIAELENLNDLLPLYRWLLAANQKFPRLSRRLFQMAGPFASMRMTVRLLRKCLRFLQPCDAEALRDARAFDACFESQRQAWRASALGVLTDAQIFAQPWGFPLEEIRVPVRLWQGKNDRTFSCRLAEQMAERLPNCELHLIDNAGHYSLPIRNMREILLDLVRAP